MVLLSTDSNINCVCSTLGGPWVEFCSALLIKCKQTFASVPDSCCNCSLSCHGFEHVELVLSSFNVNGVANNLVATVTCAGCFKTIKRGIELFSPAFP